MFPDDELIMISALQYVLFCERQFALIHLEQLWGENVFTAEGALLHERVHVPHHESRKRLRQEYSLPVRSDEYGLIGVCDLVELKLDSRKQVVGITPIEFKRGRSKPSHIDEVQLCAQAICLVEMLAVPITLGQIYYLQERRRTDVVFSSDLVEETKMAIVRCRDVLEEGRTPIAEFSTKKCKNCSLLDQCFPAYVGKEHIRVSEYVDDKLSIGREGG